MNKYFGDITLLTTHYNRSHSLERLLGTFENEQIRFNEIVISDDGSRPEHLKRLKELEEKYKLRIIYSDKNRGLANNLNKGQAVIGTPYTLYVQEDFVPTEKFAQSLNDGWSLIKENPDIDLVRFYAYKKYPYRKPLKNGFSEMEFHFWRPNFWQFYCYSDHPHLRRSNFTEKFGQYREGINSDKAEYLMMISFLKKKGKAIIHEDYQGIFDQKNDSQEPSQVGRKRFKKYIQLTDFFLIRIIRTVYRNLKFRFDYLRPL